MGHNQNLKLYHYWRSSTSWRVRWVFALKGIECQFQSINLLSDEPDSPEHRARNPLGYVPVLEVSDDGGKTFRHLSQSLAIISFAESIVPQPSIYPEDPFLKSWANQLAETINSDTAPLQNLSAQYLYSDDSEKRKFWARHWIANGLGAYETLVKPHAGQYSVGDTITLADLCLIPQVYNAIRYEVDLKPYPQIMKIYERARATESCIKASPEAYEPKSS